MPVAVFALVDAMTAIFSGQCDTVLLYYAFTRAALELTLRGAGPLSQLSGRHDERWH